MKLQMPTKDIPVDEANLSPALAALTATITMPVQYGRFVQVTVAALNSQCASTMKYIER